ncbi:hypothetical protein JCM10212_006054 [Sporobolomyces blumeae]
MNQIQQIQRINQQELDSGATASWHDQYKDSAYINVGGLPFNLTEGDVITIFSQYGEIVDINMPRDKATGKVRGFAWIMYYDQRSTVLAVDNLNGATILGRMIRVDHTLNYKQLEKDEESGKMKEREQQSFAADPRNFVKDEESDAESDISLPPGFDPEDPMAEYILSQKRDAKQKRKRIEGGDGKDEKRRRKEERRIKREERERRKERRGITGASERDGRDSKERRDGRERERERDKPYSRRDDRVDDRDGGDRRRRDDGDGDAERYTSRRDRVRDSRSPPRRRADERDDRRRGYDDERVRESRRDDDSRRTRGEGGGRGGSGRGGAFADLEKWARG